MTVGKQNAKLFSDEEEEQLKSMFSLSADNLRTVLDAISYTYEQAAFTSTGPEALYEILLGGGFDEQHAKVTMSSFRSRNHAELTETPFGFRL